MNVYLTQCVSGVPRCPLALKVSFVHDFVILCSILTFLFFLLLVWKQKGSVAGPTSMVACATNFVFGTCDFIPHNTRSPLPYQPKVPQTVDCNEKL